MAELELRKPGFYKFSHDILEPVNLIFMDDSGKTPDNFRLYLGSYSSRFAFLGNSFFTERYNKSVWFNRHPLLDISQRANPDQVGALFAYMIFLGLIFLGLSFVVIIFAPLFSVSFRGLLSTWGKTWIPGKFPDDSFDLLGI